jgi:hypothetical protein
VLARYVDPVSKVVLGLMVAAYLYRLVTHRGSKPTDKLHRFIDMCQCGKILTNHELKKRYSRLSTELSPANEDKSHAAAWRLMH